MPKIRQRVGNLFNLKIMAVNLSNVKEGDIFKTKSGEYMGYLLSDSPIFGKYQHKLYNLKNKTQYLWYNNDGVCGDESKRDQFNLVEKIDQLSEEEKLSIENAKNTASVSQDVTTSQTVASSDMIDVSYGWETALKAFSWLVFAGSFIAFFILLGNSYTVGIAFGILGYGVVQLFPIMVFANISVSLKEANELNKKILKEIKQSNKQKEETK